MEEHIANIRDVAKKAGVSIATVSHVLNRSRYVSIDLIEKVNWAIQELAYTPRIENATKASQKIRIICLILPDSSQPLMAELSRNIEDILSLNKYSVVVSNTQYDINRELKILQAIRSKMIDGILIIPSTNNLLDIDEIQAARTPIVSIDREFQNGQIDCVLTDNENAGFLATEHLIKLGHKHIGYIDRTIDQSHSVERREGFLKAITQYGLKLKPKYILRTKGFSFKDGEAVAEELLKQNPRPSAIVALNDDLAIGAINQSIHMGFKVPRDISIIGYGNTKFGEEYIPSLTTINYPAEKIARTACNLMLSKISNKSLIAEKQRKIVAEHRLIVRNSTGRAKTK